MTASAMVDGNQLDGADCVVVARDDVIDLVRVAVGIDDSDDRNAQLLGFANSDFLLSRVNDEQRARQLVHGP